MRTIKQILKEELSKRDQLRARVKELYLKNLMRGYPGVGAIYKMGFDYNTMIQDLNQWATEWAEEGLNRLRSYTPKTHIQEKTKEYLLGCKINIQRSKMDVYNSIQFKKKDYPDGDIIVFYKISNGYFSPVTYDTFSKFIDQGAKSMEVFREIRVIVEIMFPSHKMVVFD